MTEGMIENSDFNHYFFVIGSYIEIIVFSFILANRFHKIQNERIKIQRELISIKHENEQILETKVEDRTDKINKLLKEKELLVKEVHHRVKNNFQILISLFSLEASKDKNRHHKNFLLELKNRIKSMSLIHKYLISSDNFSEIESRKYFFNIIDEIKMVSYTQTININQEIDSYILSVEEAISLGVIINELLANAIKHHPSKNNNIQECNIFISFKIIGKNITLIIEDNGIGFDKNNISEDGLGLDLINQFSKKLNSHNSNDNFTFNNRTRFELTWSSLQEESV